METIGISPRFFTHELNNYADWETAFWRELIQNSVDENCSRIEIEIAQHSDGCHIKFCDNGPGMTEDTMRNIYFQLGATGKEKADTIGGHGRARILTCFAHEHYSIRTQNLLCNGTGGSFSIQNNLAFLKGCEVCVRISASQASSMETLLKDYLKWCQLPCFLSINGTPFQEWLYKRKATRTLSFGTIHTTKQKENTLAIRVRGVTMFQRYLSCKTSAIIEIDALKSREILTVSRDQLKWDAQHELNKFITEITIDNKSLSRDCSVNKTEIYGKFKKIGMQKEKKEKHGEHVTKLAGECETTWYGGNFQSAAFCTGTPATNASLEIIPENNSPYEFSVHYEDAPRQLNASAKRFHKENISGNRLKLLVAWDETIRFFLEEIHKSFFEETHYLPGFVFGTGIGGLHKIENSGDVKGHIIYINPLDENGKINLSCQDYSRLFAIGAHECAHTIHDYHNEEFAAVQTTLTQKTVDRVGELKTRIRNAIANI